MLSKKDLIKIIYEKKVVNNSFSICPAVREECTCCPIREFGKKKGCSDYSQIRNEKFIEVVKECYAYYWRVEIMLEDMLKE
jgi:hypothetical protein